MLMPNQVAQARERRMRTVACMGVSTPGVRPASGATTFRQLVDARRPIAARALLDKAYLANRLAKLSRGHTRLAFYRLKTDCLSAAIEVYPDAFWIDAAEPRGISAILSIRSRLGTSLHVAAAGLSLRARACLTQGRLDDPEHRRPSAERCLAVVELGPQFRVRAGYWLIRASGPQRSAYGRG